MKKYTLLILVIIGCNRLDSVDHSEWLIPRKFVVDGGPGKDGIPALTDPEMVSTDDEGLDYLQEDDLVLVYRNEETIKAYSHRILDYHEIINDDIGDKSMAVTYCPLTGTGIGWDRYLDGVKTTFGVSGLLYESNLMPYDRLTDSYWHQMFNQCVTGELLGSFPKTYNLHEMPLSTLKKFYSEALVNTNNTGHSRAYAIYPYGNYKETRSLVFPVSSVDSRLYPKERVRLVVADSMSMAVRFPTGAGRKLYLETLGNTETVTVADSVQHFIVTFHRMIDGEELNFTLLEDPESADILMDQLGNTWDILGTATSGPNAGETLSSPYSYMGFWFAVSNFFPDVVIIEDD